MTGAYPASSPSTAWGVPAVPPVRRVQAAYTGRHESDYYFTGIGTVIFLTVITCGIYGLFIFYQLMRRMRDHNRRRLELLEGATEFAWDQANARGVAEELRPNFERVAAHLGVLRQIAGDFREPAVWLAIVIGAALATSGVLGFVPWMIGLVLIDGDLVKHDRNEGAVEAELSAIYTRLGQEVPAPDPSRVKGEQNYAGRIVATIFTCTIYGYWWMANAMRDGNRHFEWNWPWEDALANAVQALEASTPAPRE
jgi:Domain of unknown function (DUF4234)